MAHDSPIPAGNVRYWTRSWNSIRALSRREIAWHLVAAISASLIGLALLAKIGEDVFEHESGGFDSTIRLWFLAHRTPFGDAFFLWVTRVGATAPVIVVAILIGAWLWKSRGRRVGGSVIFAPAAAVAIYDIGKLIYARARPAGAIAARIYTYSFPSGHTTTAAAVVITVAYVLWRERLLPRNLAIAIGIVVPLLIGVSRIYLDVHWATDVLGGWAIGIVIFGLCAAAYERERRRAERPPAVSETRNVA
jgi:membrane-associated phospholipid phosphatase